MSGVVALKRGASIEWIGHLTMIEPALPIDMREGVIWAYRHILGREPDSEAAIAFHIAQPVEVLRQAFFSSPEYQGTSRPTLSAPTPLAAVTDRFQPFYAGPGAVGSWRDFLGVQTRCSFLPEACQAWSGTVLTAPGRGVSGVHDEAEWLGTLRSVLEARDRLVVVELGAGWAPWLVSSAKAAARVGITDVRLIGVEGSLEHVDFMHRHFMDNDIDPAKHRLIHAVVGTEDGVARFPKLADPSDNYGAIATFAGGVDQDTDLVEVPSISLQTLLADTSQVDLLHCDIQGMEGEVFRTGWPMVEERVRRVVIGTHGRAIEEALHAQFSANRWVLEADTCCQFVQVPWGPLVLSNDGTQVWRNPRFETAP